MELKNALDDERVEVANTRPELGTTRTELEEVVVNRMKSMS